MRNVKDLKVFFAGRVSFNSAYAPTQWREDLTKQLNALLTSKQISDISHIYHRNAVIADNHLPPSVIFGQSCYYLSQADVCVVNLSDDISVGGSQELFIAKLLGIPVIALAPRNGKFNRLRYELDNKVYWNWLHPFIGALSDVTVQNIDELALALDNFEQLPVSGIISVGDAVSYYQEKASAVDTTVNRILSFNGHQRSFKPALRVYFAGKMNKAANFPEASWRDHLSAIISNSSRFRSVNLDFLEVSHAAISENDPRLIFGRDAYLIRSADLVVVNLSDDISVGGSIEMLLAKLYHRPLIGIAKKGGKFVADERDMMGRTVTNYVNPFVSATCDWLVHEPSDLPQTVDTLFTHPVKNSGIVNSSMRWYKKQVVPKDRVAQRLTVAG